jgi:purine-binding chemotaxis protein CheW
MSRGGRWDGVTSALVDAKTRHSLICRVGSVLCAIPIEHVVETMRPPAVDGLPGMPRYVAGMTIIRGGPMPVVVASRLFGKEETSPERLVVIRAGPRKIGLAVDGVLGVRPVAGDLLQRLPPLFGAAAGEAVSDIGTLDGDLMVVLQAARTVPDEVFAALEAESAAS